MAVTRGASVAIGLALVGCAIAPASTVNPTVGATPASCQAIDLRSPSGKPVDLTGIWETGSDAAGDRRIFELRQVGSCVYWSGRNAFPTRFAGPVPRGESPNVFRGVLHSDFSLVGEWVETPGGDPRNKLYHGTFSLHLNFVGTGPAERVQLELKRSVIADLDTSVTSPGPVGTLWVQVADAAGRPLPSP
jgi:hypothetical protein